MDAGGSPVLILRDGSDNSEQVKMNIKKINSNSQQISRGELMQGKGQCSKYESHASTQDRESFQLQSGQRASKQHPARQNSQLNRLCGGRKELNSLFVCSWSGSPTVVTLV